MKKRGKSEISQNNFFPKNQRGQFYLIAGIIIITMLIGFISIINYSKKNYTTVVKDVKEELKIETQKVLEYDLGHSGETIREFGVDYSESSADTEFYFITGENPQIKAYQYLNGIETEISTVSVEGDKIILTLEETDYEFDLMPEENFYFIISQEIKGEKFVVSG